MVGYDASLAARPFVFFPVFIAALCVVLAFTVLFGCAESGAADTAPASEETPAGLQSATFALG